MNQENKQPDSEVRTARPFFLSILCVALFVYAAFMTLLFVLSLVYNQWLREVVTDYFNTPGSSGQRILLIGLFGLVMHIVLLSGSWLMWRLKRLGYFLTLAVFILLIIMPFIFGVGSWFSTLIYVLAILLFSVYYRIFS
ncbi:MAG: hypothetical protein KDC05_09285 [Bacteroidales bacterium]|nr:hypothetical protein [Bacteroidales bacterium]